MSKPARQFTAVHMLPAGQVPDVSQALVSMFGPALLLAIDRRRADANPFETTRAGDGPCAGAGAAHAGPVCHQVAALAPGKKLRRSGAGPGDTPAAAAGGAAHA